MDARALARVLASVTTLTDENLLTGFGTADDAAVYKLDAGRALVSTVDFFTPIVDDPFTYGWIAAVNSLSDVYAMGGTPRLALNVVGFPQRDIGEEVLEAVLQGGAAACKEEGVILAGGHTIRSQELFYGLVALGFVSPDKIMTNTAARPGDRLVLTKAIGTGVVGTAVKAGDADLTEEQAAAASMMRSNRNAARLMGEFGVRAGTDITGFGLLGHAWELAQGSAVSLRIYANRVPALPGAMKYAASHIPGGLLNNLAWVKGHLRVADKIPGNVLNLLADPQTSGGLLVALGPDAAEAYAEAVGSPAAVIGEVTAETPPLIEIV